MIGWTHMGEWFFHVLNATPDMEPHDLAGIFLSSYFQNTRDIFGDTDTAFQSKLRIRIINWQRICAPDKRDTEFLSKLEGYKPVSEHIEYYPYYYLNRKSLFDFMKSNKLIPAQWITLTNKYPDDELDWASLAHEFERGEFKQGVIDFVTNNLEIRNDAAFKQIEYYDWPLPETWLESFGIDLPHRDNSSHNDKNDARDCLLELAGAKWLNCKDDSMRNAARMIQNIWLPGAKLNSIEEIISDTFAEVKENPKRAQKRYKRISRTTT